MAVGYLVSILRSAGYEVRVFSPLAIGVLGLVREKRQQPWHGAENILRYHSATSRNRLVHAIREKLALLEAPQLRRKTTQVAASFSRLLADDDYDAVLVSTYLMYDALCERIGQACQRRGLPLVIGGQYFAQPTVREEWLKVSGLTALVGGEIEHKIPDLVSAVIEGRSVDGFTGFWTPGSNHGVEARPMKQLDSIPFPDYRDFPWKRYPNRIIPIITGRGCGWGVCMFCSDITSTAGRTYRSRSPQNVLDELAFQSQRHQTNLFVFTDLKLNSNLSMWDGLIDNIQDRVPGAQWVCSVHIGATGRHGLDAARLGDAHKAGLVRLTTGLESGSQRILNTMNKGTCLEETSDVLRGAKEAGISVRVTMIIGYPGEEEQDLLATADFLDKHARYIERVHLNRLAIMTGTKLHKQFTSQPDQYDSIVPLRVNNTLGQVTHYYKRNRSWRYRQAVNRVLLSAHRINRRPLLAVARAYEGVM